MTKLTEWDSRELGASPESVRVVSEAEASEIDDVMELQLISIRLQKQLIEDLKLIAKQEGIGYQPLIRQALTRFVRDSNLK
ncbi:MAG: hypothetical protein R3D26_05300 [Cyanobacteriota/Melainabacteria group bacterium]